MTMDWLYADLDENGHLRCDGERMTETSAQFVARPFCIACQRRMPADDSVALAVGPDNDVTLFCRKHSEGIREMRPNRHAGFIIQGVTRANADRGRRYYNATPRQPGEGRFTTRVRYATIFETSEQAEAVLRTEFTDELRALLQVHEL